MLVLLVKSHDGNDEIINPLTTINSAGLQHGLLGLPDCRMGWGGAAVKGPQPAGGVSRRNVSIDLFPI